MLGVRLLARCGRYHWEGLPTKSGVVGSTQDRCVLREKFGGLGILYQNGRLFLRGLDYLAFVHYSLGGELLSFVQVEVSVVLVHRVLGGAFLGDRVVVDDVVVGLLENLPRLGHGFEQALLRDPEQLPVVGVGWVHSEEARVVFDLLLLGRAVRTLRHRVVPCGLRVVVVIVLRVIHFLRK